MEQRNGPPASMIWSTGRASKLEYKRKKRKVRKMFEDNTIFLNAEIMKHWLWKKPQALKAWLGILLAVSDTEKRTEWPAYAREPITLYPGQICTSITKLSKMIHCDSYSLEKYMEVFEEYGLIEVGSVDNMEISREYFGGSFILTVPSWCAESEAKDMEKQTGEPAIWGKAGKSTACNVALEEVKRLARKGGEM